MPCNTIEFSVDAVFPFVKGMLPGLERNDGMRAIGLRKDGDLVAGAVYEGFNGHNIWVHLAAVPGARWMTREYLRKCFAYPFELCGVDRLSGYVDASNHAARRLNEHFGYKEEARLRGAAPDGGDVIIYVMWRDQCRFLGV